MIVTTARKGANSLAVKARLFTGPLESDFVKRDDTSIEELLALYDTDVLVIGKKQAYPLSAKWRSAIFLSSEFGDVSNETMDAYRR